MTKFVLFLKKIYVGLLFILLEAFALHFYANSTDYTRAKMLAVSNTAVGGIYGVFADIGAYFSLGKQNRMLVGEIARLQNELESYQRDASVQRLPEGEIGLYEYTPARVINQSVSRQENFISLDRGLRDGVTADMAVVTPDGCVAGYVLACSEKYAVAISVLNTSFRTSGAVKGKDFFGSVYWDGVDHRQVVLSEIPKYAQLAVGDTVVTTQYSSIFPPDVLIGTVAGWELKNATFYEVRVDLATPMSRLKDVLLVHYTDAAERRALEQETAASRR